VTASELAFLAFGLLLGAASGAALLMLLGSRMGRGDVRVTVTRDAVPRRSETLSQDAFLSATTGPAPGGPGDRRAVDRARSESATADATATALSPADPTPTPVTAAAPAPVGIRTVVPSRPPVAIPIHPEVDRDLEAIRRRPVHGTPIERMLRGDHLAMVEIVDAVAGDGAGRRAWDVLLGGLVDAMAAVAIRESVIDVPMGTPFWDQFTVEQCRRIAASLASMGYRYDGADGWADGRTPVYRDMTLALADIGVEPRRIRVWPNQHEIAALYVGARPAPDELLAAAGPDYTAEAMRTLLGEHAAGLEDLWLAWGEVQPLLFTESEVVREAIRAERTAG
jgi:hypothetical protein